MRLAFVLAMDALIIIVLAIVAVAIVGRLIHPKESGRPSYSTSSFDDEESPPGTRDEFHTKIAGVSHSNDDGSSRQLILRRCRVGDQVLLSPEPDNPSDKNAIKACLATGEQLGYLGAYLASEMAERLHQGERFVATISALTGGTDDGPTLGCNILIKKCAEETVVISGAHVRDK